MDNSTLFKGKFNFYHSNEDLMVQYDSDAKSAIILINRPNQLNALNKRLIQIIIRFFK